MIFSIVWKSDKSWFWFSAQPDMKLKSYLGIDDNNILINDWISQSNLCEIRIWKSRWNIAFLKYKRSMFEIYDKTLVLSRFRVSISIYDYSDPRFMVSDFKYPTSRIIKIFKIFKIFKVFKIFYFRSLKSVSFLANFESILWNFNKLVW